MHLKSIRRMYGFEERWRWKHHFLLVTWFVLLAAAPPKAHGYFLGDTKAVLHGCEDHWTLQDRAAMPLLFQMTVCMDIRVMGPGSWVAFSYSSVYAPRPELGLEGDDRVLYVWLLRVQHRFPIQLSLKHWHRVCLRRDRQRNSFSLEVDGQTMAERTVVAQAIPASGSLWLGCHLRDRHSEAQLGQVELYMFRIWADLDDHPSCEDGTVIGWDSRYWGVTSPSAKQTDHNLPCGITTPFGRGFSPPPVPSAETNSGPVLSTADSPLSSQTPATTGSPPLNCNISGLCSDTDAYFWMFLSVEARNSSEIRKDVTDLLTKAFGCRVNASQIFCQGGTNVQVVEVSCGEQRDVRNTTCGVLLKLSHAVSACDLQLAGAPALQQAGSERARARIIGEVERVGRNLCENLTSPGDNFVRCNLTSSLDDVCQSNTHSTFKCSPLQLNYSDAALQPTTHSCSRQGSRFCDCSAFCNSSSQFFATRININTPSVDISLLKRLLLTLSADYPEISNHYKNTQLECQETTQRLTSCMVILEMSGSVNGCSLSRVVQRLIDSNSGITNEKPLTRMVLCGSPGSTVPTLLASNLTWVASDQPNSTVCQPNSTSEANETLAVLLTDSCPAEPSTTTHSSFPTTTGTSEASAPSVTNNNQQTNTTTDNTTAEQQKNATQGIAQPDTTTSPTTSNGTQSSPAQLAQTTFQSISTARPVTSIPNNTTNYTVTTTDAITPSPGNTTVNNITTVSPVTPSPNNTTNYTVTATDTTTPTPSNTTVYNITSVSPLTSSPNNTTNYNVTTADTTTPSLSNTAVYNITTATTDAVTTSPSNTTVNNIPTASPVTTSIPNNTPDYTVTTTDAVTTPSPSNTTVYNITTVTPVTSIRNNTPNYTSNTTVNNIPTASPVT
ncbi:mucin-3A, partial [Hippoglossus hippoglossus]|uniref:mucin-3A n=1 Tax=Hippoglossus hippoglossus TaxID=8267 RepID=UPI00148DAC2C